MVGAGVSASRGSAEVRPFDPSYVVRFSRLSALVMEAALEAAERLVREQASKLEEIRSGHVALVEALRSLRGGCRDQGGVSGAAEPALLGSPSAGFVSAAAAASLAAGASGAGASKASTAEGSGRDAVWHTPERRPHFPANLGLYNGSTGVAAAAASGANGATNGAPRNGGCNGAAGVCAAGVDQPSCPLPVELQQQQEDSGARRASSTPADAGSKRRQGSAAAGGVGGGGSGLGTLDSSAMRVVAAAHAKGLLLSDLETLPDQDWVELGATPAMRHIILQAIREWRQRLNVPAVGADRNGDAANRIGSNPAGQRAKPFQGGVDSPWYVPSAAEDPPYQRKTGILNGDAPGSKPLVPPEEDGLNGPRPMRDHIVGGTAAGDGAGAHGHARANDFDRIVGHAKAHHPPPRDQIVAGVGMGDEVGAGGHIKDMCFQDGLERGIGHGRHHLYAKDHIYAGVADDDSAGKYGHQKDTIFVGGLQRGIGHGRRHIEVVDHVFGGATVDDVPGSHGQLRDDHFQGGLQHGIGHGRHHFQVVDHIRGGTAVEDPAGAHGHSKDDDFQDGIQRGIGHGRRHLASGFDAVLNTLEGGGAAARARQLSPSKQIAAAVAAAAPPPQLGSPDKDSSQQSPGGASDPGASERPAGLPSRYATINGSNTSKRLCW